MIQKTVTRRLLLATALVVSLSMAACQRSPRQPGTANAAAAGGASAAVTTPVAPRTAGTASPAGASTAAAAPAAPAASPGQKPSSAIVLNPQKPTGEPSKPSAFSDAASLMALGRSTRILPEDFKIGLLGDDRTGAADQSAAMAAAGIFLAALVAGNVDAKLIVPDSQAALVESLKYEMANGNTPKSFRLGAPTRRDDGEVTAPLRLFAEQSSTEGEIYLAPVGRLWLVEDMQISLGELAVKKEKSKDKYFPSDYRWLLQE